MAKRQKRTENKSEAIRIYDKSNPGETPKQVAAALHKKGISVTPQFVSTIRSVTKRKGGRVGKPGRPKGTGTKAKQITLETLLAIRQVIDDLGGIEPTKKAIEAYEKLVRD